MAGQADPFLRTKQSYNEAGLSKSRFYILRQAFDAGAPEPDGFPPPDAFLNEGRTPVWLQSTVARWKAALVAQSRAKGYRQRLTHRHAAASVLAPR